MLSNLSFNYYKNLPFKVKTRNISTKTSAKDIQKVFENFSPPKIAILIKFYCRVLDLNFSNNTCDTFWFLGLNETATYGKRSEHCRNKIFYTRIGTVTENEINITMNYKVLWKWNGSQTVNIKNDHKGLHLFVPTVLLLGLCSLTEHTDGKMAAMISLVQR